MGQFSSKSDHEPYYDSRTPEYQILRTVYHVLSEKNSTWLKHITYDHQATISQIPVPGPVNENKKLRSATEVEVFDPTPSEATELFLTDFKLMLHKEGIIVKKIEKVTDGKTPVILVCNMATRLEADIDRALSSVRKTDYSRIVLIALHVKPKHALPQEGSMEQLCLQEEKYQGLRGVVDIAYTRENRFYNWIL